MRLVARLVSGIGVLLVLTGPVGAARAEDDPGPAQWTKIDPPQNSDRSDPSPARWTTVEQPNTNSSIDDPKPNDWPTIDPG